MSNLRHWRARTTSATSSSTSATRRVAVVEELLRDLSKLGPLGLCPLSRCILLLQHAVSLSPAPRLLAGVCPRGCRSGLYHGWVRWRQARRIALQIHALRRCAESTSGRHIRALSGGPAVLASCPADRLHTILASAAACTLLRARARRAMVLVSGDGRAQALTLAAAVLCACILVPARFTRS